MQATKMILTLVVLIEVSHLLQLQAALSAIKMKITLTRLFTFLLTITLLFSCSLDNKKSCTKVSIKNNMMQKNQPSKILWLKYGMTPPNEEELIIAARKLGFEYGGSLGCSLKSSTIDSINKNNKMVDSILTKTIGKEWRIKWEHIADSLFFLKNQRPQAPKKMANIPAGAFWIGGVDGGNWCLINNINTKAKTVNLRIYNDFNGKLLMNKNFKLNCNPDVGINWNNLKEQIDYFDGQLVYLSVLGADGNYCYFE